MILALRRYKLVRNLGIAFLSFGLIAVSGFIYLSINAVALFADAQHFIENRLSQSFNADVAVDSLQLNIVGPVVLNGLSLSKPVSQDTTFMFRSDRVVIYTNLLRIAVNRIVGKTNITDKDFSFKIENGFLYRGEQPLIKNVNGYGKIVNNIFIFDDLNGRCYNFPITVHTQTDAAGDSNKKKVWIELKARKIGLRSQLYFELDLSRPGRVSGRIKSEGTILDHKPFKELEGDFFIEGSVLNITALRLGSEYILSGTAQLQKPYILNLTLDIKNSALEGMIDGAVNGFIKTKGPPDDLATAAKFECGPGRLGNLDYESMNVNLDGRGPVLKVVDSRILRKEGYIELSGEVDVRKLWSSEPAKGLRWTCGNEAIVWEGWDILKQTNSQELEMKKGIGQQKEFMVTFKGYLNDEQSWQDATGLKQNETVGVEYNLDEAKKVKMQLKSNEEVFSLEHKVRF